MGNGAFKMCMPEDRKDYDKNTINFKSKSGNPNTNARRFSEELKRRHTGDAEKDEGVDLEFAAKMLQSAVRIFFAGRRMKLLKEVKENFENEFLKHLESNREEVDREVKERKSKSGIDNNSNGEIQKELSTYTAKCDYLTIYYGPLKLRNENNDIYEGHWRLINNSESNNNGQFIKYGLGVVYQEDGTIIQGVFNENIISNGKIYYPDGKIYEGEIIRDNTSLGNSNSNYLPHGRGKLYINKRRKEEEIMKSNGKNMERVTDGSKISRSKITHADWVRGVIHGECEEEYPGKFRMKTQMVNGKSEGLRAKFIYEDGSVYEGEYDSKFRKHGYGRVIYSNNSEIYEGYWRKDKYHGPGMLFIPSSGVTGKNTNDNCSTDNSTSLSPSLEPFKWGRGKYTKGIWNEGLLNGEGTIHEEEKITNCFWRFGKLIQSMTQLKVKVISLHPNIFSFLNQMELISLFKLRNRHILFHFLNNNFSNLIKLRLSQMMDIDFNTYHPKSGSHSLFANKYLLNNSEKIRNIEEVIDNYQEEKESLFLPLVAFKTNGGLVEKRFHYSNIFNPIETDSYISNYLHNKSSDILIQGVLSNWSAKSTKDKIIKSNTLKKKLLKFKVKYQQEISEENLLIVLKDRSRDYITHYKDIFKEYKIDFYQLLINEKGVVDKVISDQSNHEHLFTLHQLLVFLPQKVSLYTFMLNPVRTLAIYIHNKECEDKTECDVDKINKIDMESFGEEEEEQEKNTNTNKNNAIRLPLLIRKVNNNSHIVLEFDTQKQFQENPNKKQLLALIRIQDYSNPYHLFSFKNYFHLGKYLTIHLIDQTSLFGAKPTSIEITSTLCFGQVFKVTK